MGTATEKPGEAMHVPCEVCLKAVPSSEAIVAEATDYFACFCGLKCYEEWKHRGERNPAVPAAASISSADLEMIAMPDASSATRA